MPLIAFAAVVLAAVTHATWNLFAKRAAGAQHFVWLYSAASALLYAPIVIAIVQITRPHFTLIHWLALLATATLHLGYSLTLQAGYRASDLSVVYPLARGSGPLLSFLLAAIILHERVTWLSIAGVCMIVIGILLIAGFLSGAVLHRHHALRRGILFGLGTGLFIASYTINDGWAVKTLLISPFIVDFAGNIVRVIVLSPRAWLDRVRVAQEIRDYKKAVLVVCLLGPLGYILVLYAMRLAPISHVAPARELATLIGTYFGSRLLKEQAAPARVAGALCIVAGVISLAFASPQ